MMRPWGPKRWWPKELDRGTLRQGDHIYTWRVAEIYAHHGIYVGDDKVIHFTTNSGGVVGSSSNTPQSTVRCSTCNHTDPMNGVVSSCLDCFLAGGFLYLYEYSVTPAIFATRARGGTCAYEASDPPETVVHRANQLLDNNNFGRYNLITNNCEHFAVYCKRGVRVDLGLSGQVGHTIVDLITGTRIPNPFLP